MRSTIRAIIDFLFNSKKSKPAVKALAMLVVFVTTYMLILPAFTLERDEAVRQGGIDVPSVETAAEEVSGEDAGHDASETEAITQEKEEAKTEAKAGTDGNTEDKAGPPSASAAQGDPLTFEGDGYTIAVDDKRSILPDNTEVVASELLEKPAEGTKAERKEAEKAYKKYYDLAQEAVKGEDGADNARTISFVKFYDISLQSAGEDVQPDKPVNVTISYDKDQQKELTVEEKKNIRIIHFAEDKETGEITAEILKDDSVDVSLRQKKMEETTFEAESFSVYAVVYTVDFSYEVNGKAYSFSMNGADSVSLRALIEALHVYEQPAENNNGSDEGASQTEAEVKAGDLDKSEDAVNAQLDGFMNDIKTVTFSNTDLLVPAKVEKDTTVGQIKTDLKLFPTYPLGLKQSEVLALNAKKYAAGDWVLISMKAFDTEETLTVAMDNGESFDIHITDAQDAQMVGDQVLTVSNPAGTTIDLFDYWIVSQDLVGRDGWGDLNQDWGKHPDTEGDNGYNLNGSGNNKGINSSSDDEKHGHALKFSPAWDGTVYNGTKIGTHRYYPNWDSGDHEIHYDREEAWRSLNRPGEQGLNNYTGNGNPFQGIVQGQLVNGYPILTENDIIGSNGESLAYLFDPSVSHTGKASYSGADQLLYVDKDGYYTYDSRDYAASFDSGDKTFTLTEQTSDNGEIRGFWPFGTQNFWSGMHINTQFSMPVNGQVLNPKGEYKDMQFEFSGDDDTWLYIDGVLVGDGGGIHNRTEIDVNFAKGTVTVTGEKAGGHSGGFDETKYLDDIFIAAGKYNDADWEDIGDGSGHKRFKAGTYHTFDMFYLERGGGESNLYIHYNLISTADFTAHKSYQGFDNDDVLQRNQFRFELIGLDGKYRSVWSEAEGDYILVQEDTTSEAIMPHASSSGAGTTVSPYYSDGYSVQLSNGTTADSQIYITGNVEDGNVNFGNAQISEQDMHDCDEGNPPVYRYIVREVIPDDAVNLDNVTWKDATPEQRAAGGFVKDSVIYDGSIYYMSARVTSWEETDARGQTVTRYGLSKTYYTDDTYTTKKTDSTFIDFRNRYTPEHADFEFDKVDVNGEPVPGAVFGLFRDSACKIQAKNNNNEAITATSDTDGKVRFTDARTGIFFMKEISAPDPYDLNPTVYRVTISKQGSHMSINSDQNNTPVTEVYNFKDGDITVNKKWVDANGNETSGEGHPSTVQLRRYRYFRTGKEPETHSVTLHFHFPDAGWNTTKMDFGPYTVTGNSVVIHWPDEGVNYTSREGYSDLLVKGNNLYSLQLPLDGDLDLNFDGNVAWGYQKLNSDLISVDGTMDDSKELRLDESFPSATEMDKATQTLTADSHMHAWSIGVGDEYDFPPGDEIGQYYYYLVELDASGHEVAIGDEVSEGMILKSIEYSPEKYEDYGITHGLITVTNQLDEKEISLDILKVKKDDANTKLPRAKFALRKLTNDPERNYPVPTPDGTIDGTAVTGSPVTTSSNGEASYTGLTQGYYELTETKAPEGYVLTDEITAYFMVNDGVVTWVEWSASENNWVEKTTDTMISFEAARAAVDDDPDTPEDETVQAQNAKFTVENEQGAALPHTGGIGTTIFYILGSILAIGCAVVLISRRRLHRN